MLTIWGRRTSANVQKVLWAADELGIAWHNIPAGGAENIDRHDELMARNPNGLVPVIEDREITLWESNAILRHLARLYPNTGLYGGSLAESARVDQWMDWQASTLWPAMLPYFVGLARTPREDRDDTAIVAARRQTLRNFSILEQYLQPGTYIVGAHLTIADIALGAFIHRWLTLDHEATATQPLLTALYERYRGSTAYMEHICDQPFQ